MKNLFFLPWLSVGLWAVPIVAPAQVRVSVGPQIGYNLSTTHFQNFSNSTTGYRSGLSAGLAGSLASGHLALQVAALYSQQGYQQSIVVPEDFATGLLRYNGSTRLDYLTLPVSLAFTQHGNGQGFQVFAGAYLSRLLGGRYESTVFIDNSGSTGIPGPPSSAEPRRGKVQTGEHYVPYSDQTYSKSLDAGLQTGIGYQRGDWRLQAGYSLGLRNISDHEFAAGVGFSEIPYYNRAFETSLTYLFRTKE